jgi:UDP-N-acetylmuramyl pentapeptide synthase
MHIQEAATVADAATVVESLLEPGDVLLVKASRGLRLEQLVDRLKAKLEQH